MTDRKSTTAEMMRRMGMYTLDDAGEPVHCDTVMEWGEWMERNHLTRHVGDDEINGYRVSTVFLGIDHGHRFIDRDAPPVLWETMIFDADRHMAFDGYQERYSSRTAAQAGHARACAFVYGNSKPLS